MLAKITANDAFEFGYCAKGQRDFFKKNNLDYKDFVRNGISSEELLSLNDELVKKLVEYVNGR